MMKQLLVFGFDLFCLFCSMFGIGNGWLIDHFFERGVEISRQILLGDERCSSGCVAQGVAQGVTVVYGFAIRVSARVLRRGDGIRLFFSGVSREYMKSSAR